MPPSSSTILKVKGVAELVVAAILTFRPLLVYNSGMTQRIHVLTGLPLTDPTLAPAFNQALACMTAAVGVGNIVGSTKGRGALETIMSMSITWGILAIAVCFTPREANLASATTAMTAINHLVFNAALYWAYASEGKKTHRD